VSDPRPHVLVTNDDGIGAPGIRHLADALAPHFDLTVVAPHQECSATGHGISVLTNLRLARYERDGRPWGWSLEGRPADCVKVAVQTISPDRPFDLVVSGINNGQNLGLNIIYSGTVAAAREGIVLGIPSIAVSVAYRDPLDVRFDTAARVALEIARRTLERGAPKGVLLNVNVPDLPYERLGGMAITRMGDSGFRDKFERIEHGEAGAGVIRNVGDRFRKSTEEHHLNDDRAIREGKVSITPLHVDATAHQHLDDLENLTRP
jgi:5'-nucleotidase